MCLSVGYLGAGCGAGCPGRPAGSPSPAGCTWSRWTKPPPSAASAARGAEPPRGRGCRGAQRRPAGSPAWRAEAACGCGWRGHPAPGGGPPRAAPSRGRSQCCRAAWRSPTGRTVWAYWELEADPKSRTETNGEITRT